MVPHIYLQGNKMKTTTLEQVKQRVLERRPTLSDEVVSIKSLMMDPAQPGRMVVRRPDGTREDSYEFDERIYSQAPGVVYGLPGAYLKKLVEGDNADPQLASLNFNHWVAASKDKQAMLRFREVDGKKILRAVRPASWNPVPYETSIDTLITKFGPDKEVGVTRFDEDMLVLDIVTRQLDYKINRGVHDIGKRDDPFKWGVRFQDSDVGIGDLLIQPYSLRLICTNGATTMSRGAIMRISHSGKQSESLDEVQSNIRQGIEMVDGYSHRVAEQITASQTISISTNPETNEPDAALARLAKDMLVTRLEEKYVREGWLVEGETIPEASVYRLHNAVTRAGTHGSELTHDERLHLQSVGGRILELATTNYRWD